jgi:hypothetical protein
MAIRFDRIKPGMTLYERHREKMGNTAIRSLCEWRVQILVVHEKERTALVSWNGNKPSIRSSRSLEKLYDWSMYDKSVAELRRGILGCVYGCRKLSKAEITARKKDPQ